ncbi:hypothetical protein BpHYR1_047171 [Brachionus plicatilis]|uniref:Uncharacterized protein n=1 Tax=Brachionus plicatilis TaxID=10195 RepID=A0A3M7S272_BRAPC|nr:hypothetical protein BpHYR1_047171 [Brachionus plicatilis]
MTCQNQNCMLPFKFDILFTKIFVKTVLYYSTNFNQFQNYLFHFSLLSEKNDTVPVPFLFFRLPITKIVQVLMQNYILNA